MTELTQFFSVISKQNSVHDRKKQVAIVGALARYRTPYALST